MQRYSIVHPLYMSFFSKDLYRDVAGNWKGLGLAYLLYLLALCTIPSVMQAQAYFSDYLATEAPAIINQMPVITISGGRASIDKPEPYYILDRKTGDPLAIIDTSASAMPGDSKAVVLLTGTSLIVRNNETTRTLDLSSLGDMTLDRGLAWRWIEAARTWFALILYPFAVCFSFLFHLAEVVLYAAFGLFVARKLRIDLRFRQVVRLAAVALSPVLIADALLVLVNVEVPYWSLLALLISMGYLLFAVRANSPTGA